LEGVHGIEAKAAGAEEGNVIGDFVGALLEHQVVDEKFFDFGFELVGVVHGVRSVVRAKVVGGVGGAQAGKSLSGRGESFQSSLRDFIDLKTHHRGLKPTAILESSLRDWGFVELQAGGDGLLVGAGGADDGGVGAVGAEAFDGGDELPGGGGAEGFAEGFTRGEGWALPIAPGGVFGGVPALAAGAAVAEEGVA